ncbi:hypothetical protein E1193_12530 [Micromonospora sp. KC606]|uniref:cellulose-binding domain-containing protein n=1 Tax=Micromonospora sp. KC606 TaxID=2530379 RepID=UPI00104D3B57|nr:cellulose-binding domain-containing protein [Micromonospora sp. KC606]TDC82178.1 hypothetical protein E1193_12530 [Micromonospora sp. KC606]
MHLFRCRLGAGRRIARRHRTATGALTLALAAAAAVLVPSTAASAATTASFTRVSEWGTGYVGEVAVHNDTASQLTGWRVEFDMPAGTTITNYWNAALTRSGSRHVFTNLAWNGVLAPGARTSFGWVTNGTGTPTGCTVNGSPCAGRPIGPDVRPPSTPTNVRVGTAGQYTALHWDPASDDHGVVRYDILANGNPFASVTGTSHTFPPLPPTTFTFGISAVDAAGNRSPYAIYYFGQRPDSAAPTAPASLSIDGPIGDHLPVRWEASRDDVFVAGYELYLNDRLISTVGGTNGFVPFTGYGVYWVAVRAFDHLGRFSAFTRIGLAIDPPAPPTSSPTG